ncbi:pyridoxamine 5'-phosphate oxidase family protein [Streptomyces sp. BR1]|uniref:pyridoxamine 5'-phosphate oxidase family protein n=1 Tax=Streptomyces sp. BR1 TaxID=1592323 RepID=UPI00402B9A86
MSTEETRALDLLHRVSYGRIATSMRALPFVAPARHIVVDGRVILRIHAGLGYHEACAGSVVAYGADNLCAGETACGSTAAGHLWSVQFTGTAEPVTPTPAELDMFGPAPRHVDGEDFDPVYLRIEPQFVTVHSLDYSPERHLRNAA